MLSSRSAAPVSRRAESPDRAGAWFDRWPVQALLLVAVCVAAVVARFYRMMDWPVFRDEVIEAIWAHDIARGVHLPLTGWDSYYGPLHSYLVAAGYVIAGPGPDVARGMAAIAGGLTVLPAYWLGRLLGGVRTGMFAAVLTALSPLLVAEIGHLGWSASLVPLLATTMLAMVCAAIQRNQIRLVVPALVMAGLTGQAHPIMVVLLPGVVAWLVLHFAGRRVWVLALSGVGLVIGYFPMVLANVGFDRSMLVDAAARPYVRQTVSGPLEYVDRLLNVGRGVVNLLSGRTINLGPESYVYSLVIVGLVLIGVVLLVRSRRWQVPAIAATGLLLVPFAVSIISNHYVSWVVPPGMVSLALAIEAGIRRFGRGGWVVAALVPLSFVVMIGQIYQRAEGMEMTNAGFRDFARFMQQSGVCDSSLMLYSPAVYRGQATNQEEIASYLLTMQGCDHRRLAGGPNVIDQPGYLLASFPFPDPPARRLWLVHEFRLPRIRPHWVPVSFGLFRVE